MRDAVALPWELVRTVKALLGRAPEAGSVHDKSPVCIIESHSGNGTGSAGSGLAGSGSACNDASSGTAAAGADAGVKSGVGSTELSTARESVIVCSGLWLRRVSRQLFETSRGDTPTRDVVTSSAFQINQWVRPKLCENLQN